MQTTENFLQERDELKDLLQHPGFHRFLKMARDEWGAGGFSVKLKHAISLAKERGDDLHNAVEKVDFANDAINALMSWPEQRLQQLEGQKDTRLFAGLRRA